MDSDLTGKAHVGSSFEDFMRETLGDEAYEAMGDRARHRVEAWAACQATKAQRRAELVTLTAAALSGSVGSPLTDNEIARIARHAVAIAEATLDLITERTK